MLMTDASNNADELDAKCRSFTEEDERLLEKWVNVCRDKVAVLKYLSAGCRLNGHLVTLIGQAENLENEVAEAVAAANAFMASKSRLSCAVFCDTTVTLSPLHQTVDRLLLDHALLRAQIATKRTACYQFANALQIFNKQYTELISGGELARMLGMLADFYANHTTDSPVVYDSVYRQKQDMEQIVKCFEEFRDDVKHLLKAARSLKFMAPQNSSNDLTRIELKITDLKSRLQEIGDWVEKHQTQLRNAEHDAKHFETTWRNLLSWIDETLLDLNDLYDECCVNNNNNGASGLKALKSAQQRVKSEKQTRLQKCVRLANKLSSKATQHGNSYDQKMIEWQASTLKERFEQLETAIDNCETEFIRTTKEDLRLHALINQCKRVINDAKTYLTKAGGNKAPLSFAEEAELLTALMAKTRELLEGQDGIALLKQQSNDDNSGKKLAEKFERQLVETADTLVKRELILKNDVTAMKSFVCAYKYCRKLVAEANCFLAMSVTFFDDRIIEQLQKRCECIENAFSVIPNTTGLRYSVTGEMADLYNEILSLKQAVDEHSKRRHRAKMLLIAAKRQMCTIRVRFSEIVKSVPASRPLRTASSHLRSPLLTEIALTKQKIQSLISCSPVFVKTARNNSRLLTRGFQVSSNKQKKISNEPLAKYLEIREATEARQLYLECTRLANKLSS